jgi:hypothetical protein
MPQAGGARGAAPTELLWAAQLPVQLRLALDNVSSPADVRPIYVRVAQHSTAQHSTACGPAWLQPRKAGLHHALRRPCAPCRPLLGPQLMAPRQGYLSSLAAQAWPHLQVAGRGLRASHRVAGAALPGPQRQRLGSGACWQPCDTPYSTNR